uniref:SFRICE_021453 n=1 Tax=Spodoptera frugiperda TaxID=7108 RepID=A0A2H1WA68_SPOFR
MILSMVAYKWPLLTKNLFTHGGLSINQHACSIRIVDLKLMIRYYYKFRLSYTLTPGGQCEHKLGRSTGFTPRIFEFNVNKHIDKF